MKSKEKGTDSSIDCVSNIEQSLVINIGKQYNFFEVFQLMVEGAALHRIIYDEKGEPYDTIILKVNHAFEEMVGLKTEEIEGQRVTQVFPEIHKEWLDSIFNAATLVKPISYESYFALPGKCYKTYMLGIENGQVLVVFIDGTEREKLKELSDKYRLIKENARDIILFINREGQILDANKAAEEAYGYEYKELINKEISDISVENESFEKNKKKIETSNLGMLFETNHRRKNGSTFPVEVSSRGSTLNGEYIMISIVRDITERKIAESEMHKLIYLDNTTKLPNRQHFSEYIIDAMGDAKAANNMMAVYFIDLDKYKKINDTMGHIVGDKLLKEVGERFAKIVDESMFASRIGGDEFIFIRTKIKTRDEIAEFAEKILGQIKASFYLNGQEVHITASMGISIYPIHGEDATTLIKNAEMSLYKVKSTGRNSYDFYTPGMNKEAFEELVIENSLHHALENNELIVFYQPKIDIVTERVVGMEALVRWQNPKLGLVPPSKFIGVAEDNGLIIPIGEWVLYTACKQNKEWQDAGYAPMRVAVNLSMRQFEEENLVEVVKKVLKDTGLDPQYLELEITETMAMKNTELIINTLITLKNMGISIAMDDFGIGYSSLKYLQNIPIDTLKIDQSFVQDVNNNSNYEAIVDAIIDIAKKLGLDIIAEGVETTEQCDILKEKSCFKMQGYLFSRPVDKHEFEKVLNKYNRK